MRAIPCRRSTAFDMMATHLMQGRNSALKKVADAAKPLYASLDTSQKRIFGFLSREMLMMMGHGHGMMGGGAGMRHGGMMGPHSDHGGQEEDQGAGPDEQ